VVVPSEQMSAVRLADIVQSRLSGSDQTVSGFWFQVLGNRERFAAELRAQLAGRSVVVLIVRNSKFDSPNSVLPDFVNLIEQNRSACESQLSQDGSKGKYGVVCLARNTLTVPQVSSPATFPDWFPKVGGRSISIVMEDLTWTGQAPLSCEEAAIPELSSVLFNLEGEMLGRLSAIRRQAPNASDSLWEYLRSDDKYRFEDFISDAGKFRRNILNETEFRPSIRERKSLLARMWRKVQCTPPESVGRTAVALADALSLPEPLGCQWHQTMISILYRPSNPARTEGSYFSHGVLVSVAAALQLVTASKHSEGYLVPVPLSRSLSYDLRAGLASAQVVVLTAERRIPAQSARLG
jgi:hypothetical protein